MQIMSAFVLPVTALSMFPKSGRKMPFSSLVMLALTIFAPKYAVGLL